MAVVEFVLFLSLGGIKGNDIHIGIGIVVVGVDGVDGGVGCCG